MRSESVKATVEGAGFYRVLKASLLAASLLAAGLVTLAAAPVYAAEPQEGDLRIVPKNGDPANKGRLDIFHDDRWGPICDDFWDQNDAVVACKQLGYSDAENSFKSFVRSSGQFWLDDVRCTGSESSLSACSSSDWGVHNCHAGETAAVECKGDTAAATAVVFVTKRSVVEQGTSGATYTIRLTKEPSGNVTVTPVVPSGSGLSVSPASLTFTTTNYSNAQTFTVTAAGDPDQDDDTYTLTHTISGGGYGSVSVRDVTINVKDNDIPGVRISPRSLTVDEGDSTGGSYTLVLTGEPTANVTVTVGDSGRDNLTVNPRSLTFTPSNWRTARSVTVTAQHDDNRASDLVTLTHSASGGGYDSTLAIDEVAVWVPDDDIKFVTNTRNIAIDEGGSATYELKPEGGPLTRMTVSVDVPSGSGLTASPSEVTFTQSNWSRSQTITVTAAHDADSADPDPATITHSVEGSSTVTADSVTVNVRDDEVPKAWIDDGGAVSIDEGGTGTYRMSLMSDPGGTATVTITAPSGLTVSPTSLSFDSSSWERMQTITVHAPQEDDDTTDETLYVTHTIALDGNSTNLDRTRVNVADDDDGEALVGPRPSDALWWAALTARRGAQSVGHIDYTGPVDVGKLSDDSFTQGGVAREIDALFVDDRGSLQLWVDSGNGSQLPNSMVLHVGGESMTLGSASRQSFGTTYTDGTLSRKRDHTYWWTSGSHSVSLSDRDVVAVWLVQPIASKNFPNTPTDVKATPMNNAVKLRWDAPEEVPGKPVMYYEVQEEGKDGWTRTDGAGTEKEVADLDNGQSYVFRLRAVNSAGKGAASAPTESVTPRANAAPTGLPTVTGTAQVGETLTASSSEIADDDGLTDAVFAWQWVANDGTSDTDIEGATEATYTLTAAETDKTIKARATFTDDGGTEETLTSAATAAVTTGLTASFSDVPASHDGSSAFMLRVLFSEAVETGFVRMRDEAFTVTGGSVNRAKRVNGRSDLWELRVEPSSNAPVTVALPATTGECTASGAICTSDDERLTAGAEVTVPGPAPTLTGASVDGAALTLTWDEALDEGSVPGSDAFAVTVAGAARGVSTVSVSASTATLTLAAAVAAGETVTVDYTVPTGAGASPIQDATGNAAAGFAGESVANATGTSNTAPTGLPTITGTAQVGETLSASSSGIADDDGLTGAAFAWQWIANDGTADADIAGATGSTYVLTAPEVGQTIKVRATFTDDGGTEETLTSAATAAVASNLSNLTAEFENVPSEHDGSGSFTLRVLFSEELASGGSGRKIAQALALTGAGRNEVRRVDGRRDLYWFRVNPSGNDAVTVTLTSAGACGGAAAVCTSDGRALSNAPEATIQGPPSLSVADTEADEGPSAALAFAVTLSRAASGPVTVAYATADVTAVAGSDYTAASGTLSFAAGETSKTVQVAVLDDSVDDDGETLTLTLSNPSGAFVSEGTATGTINNSDPLPQAWLARFGRTAADHAIDAIGMRFESSQERAHATFAGRRLWGGAPGADSLDADNDPFGMGTGIGSGLGHDASPYARQPGTYGAQPGMGMNAGSGMGMNGMSVGAGMNAGMGGGMNAGAGLGAGMSPGGGMDTGMGVSGAGGGPFGSPATRDLLIGSSFLLTAAGSDDAGGDRRLTTWGRASATRFDGAEDDLRLDGDVATFLIGADTAWDRWLAGISVAHTVGSGGFSASADEGKLDSTLTAVHPYVSFQATDRLSAWGVLGYGAGSLKLETNDSTWQTDTSMSMAAAGLRGVLLSTDAGLELAAKTDVRFTQIGSDAAVGDAGLLGETSGGTSRVRLLLEGTRPFAFGSGRMLTPSLQLGVRRDGGDAENGTGVDLGGTLRYADAALGLSVEASGRYLLAHEDSAYREWGASASISLDPGIPGRGLTLSVAPSWGADASGGAERLWSARDARGLAGYGFDTDMRLAAQVGYGFDAFKGKGSLAPFATLTSVGPSSRELSAGALWARGPALQMSLTVTRREMSLAGTRHEMSPAGTRYEVAGQWPEHGVEFRLTWRPGAR